MVRIRLDDLVTNRTPSEHSIKIGQILMDAQFKNSLTFCNLTGPDPADVEIPLQELQFFLEQFLVVPPRFHPLLPGNIIQYIIVHYLEEYHALKLSYYQNMYQNP